MRIPKRRSKIVATLGPATQDENILLGLIKNGLDVARLNFSHRDHATHLKTLKLVRKCSKNLEIPVALLADIQGPKIRVGKLLGDQIVLKKNQLLFFKGVKQSTNQLTEGTEDNPIEISYENLIRDVQKTHPIYIDDGLLKLEVTKIDKIKKIIQAQVIEEGILGERKGVHLPSTPLSATSITQKDWDDISFAIEHEFDFIALSFVRNHKEVSNLKNYLRAQNSTLSIISKIELREALDDLENIIKESDGIMVARGDLGVEIGNEKVPLVQKKIIQLCHQQAKPVITATQMLMSMVNSPLPSRAEASDVANAILDGSDAVMLSNETAVGKNPELCVQTMEKIIIETEQYLLSQPNTIIHEHKNNKAHALAEAAKRLAAQSNAKYIASLTQSGLFSQILSSTRPQQIILAFSPDPKVNRKLTLSWGVYVVPYALSTHKYNLNEILDNFIEKLKLFKLLEKNDSLVFTSGLLDSSSSGSTNTIVLKNV